MSWTAEQIQTMADDAREVARRKTAQQFPWPHHEFDKRRFFAAEAARQLCDHILAGGYDQFVSFVPDGGSEHG